jgi:hypothetical protein
MTRSLLGATLALGLLATVPNPVGAGGALIETTAPLADRSEESVKAAVVAAIDRAVRGASAMGFEWFQLRDAQVSEREVAIQILATDEPAEADTDEPAPAPAPDAGPDDRTPQGQFGGGPAVPDGTRLHI